MLLIEHKCFSVPKWLNVFALAIQVGCPLRCSFCATGKGGFSRNLKRHEIIEQVCFSFLFLHSLKSIVRWEFISLTL